MSRSRSDKKGQRQVYAKNVNRGRSMSRNRAPIVCYNCYKKGHVKKDCRSPTYCQACRDEHKPGSVDCKNAWKYAHINRKDRGNNHRYASQERSGNQTYEGSYKQNRNPQRGAYRGRGTYRQNYRPTYEDRQRYQNTFNKVSENFDSVNTLKDQSEEQRSDRHEEALNWNILRN